MNAHQIIETCRTTDGAPTLEICTNAEWLTEMGGYVERDGDCLDNEASAAFVSRLWDELERRLPRATVKRAQGQRSLFHGWNGAQFTHRHGPVGTWNMLSDRQREAIANAVDAAMSST